MRCVQKIKMLFGRAMNSVADNLVDISSISGVLLTALKQIKTEKGSVYHGLKKTDDGYQGFGEAYFSCVYPGDIKGWKKHTQMVMNLIVPVGSIKFVIYDDRSDSLTHGCFSEVSLSLENYYRLTVPSGVWLAFASSSNEESMLLNIASIEHDPGEAENCSLETIQYPW